MDGWIGLSGCGEWMWKVDSGAVPDLTHVKYILIQLVNIYVVLVNFVDHSRLIIIRVSK